MFTGIVEELGEVVRLDKLGDSGRLTVRGTTVAKGSRQGDSVAVNGVCLTVVDISEEGFAADVMAETLDRSGLGRLRAGSPVNLERAVRMDGRLGGHLVQGHVDGTGVICERTPRASAVIMRISLPTELAAYVAVKGSIAVDGVSLTVCEVTEDTFSVGLIPTTLERTTLGAKRPGDVVNLEVDVLAKYVEKLVARGVQT